MFDAYPVVRFKKLDPRAQIPAYAKPGDAGMDLRCLEVVKLGVGERKLVKVGLAVEIPLGYEGQVRARSGNALKKGVTVLNSPGTIDSGYRGELGALLVNLSDEPQEFEAGHAIAQFVIAPVCRAIVDIAAADDELSSSERGNAGFGSTDK
jgi:dUTP pyrophosphatase